MAVKKSKARKITGKALVRLLEGPERPVVVYQVRHPKYERPGHNPFAGLVPE